MAHGHARASRRAAERRRPRRRPGASRFVDNAVDQTTGTIKIKGTFPNTDRRLWPGQFVNVIVTLTTDPNAIVVPTAAVQTGQQGTYVFVVKAGPDRRAAAGRRSRARSGDRDGDHRAGLKPGETVVTDGQLRLVAGSRVSVKTATPRRRSTP